MASYEYKKRIKVKFIKKKDKTVFGGWVILLKPTKHIDRLYAVKKGKRQFYRGMGVCCPTQANFVSDRYLTSLQERRGPGNALFHPE